MAFKPNENLTGALRATLELVKNEDKAKDHQQPDQAPYPSPENSPLAEVSADALDEELDRINEHLIAGVPEKVTDESLTKLIDIFRARALLWEQEEENKKAGIRKTTKKVAHVEALKL